MIGIGIGSGSGGGGSGSVSPIGASLDLIFRDPLAVEFGSPRTIAGTTTVAGWPNVGTFTRASTADWINVAGDGLETQAGNNVLRRGPVRGALFEQGVTALARNSLMQDGSGNWPPADDTSPDGFGIATGGLTRTIRYAEQNGMRVMRVRYVGTPSSTGPQVISVPNLTGNVGEVFFQQAYVRLSAGSLTNTTSMLLRTGADSGGTVFTPTSTGRFASNVRVLSGSNARLELRWNYIDTVTPVDVEFEIGAPMTLRIDGTPLSGLTSGTIISPILTNNSSPTTRAADQLVMPVILPETTWTICGIATMPTTPNNSLENLLNLSFDTNNRFFVRRDAGNLVANTVASGTPSSGPSITAPALGARFAFCLRRNGTQLSLSINGGDPVNATPTMPVGAMPLLLVGHRSGGDGQWNSFIERLPVFPRAVSDAEMQTFSTLSTWGA